MKQNQKGKRKKLLVYEDYPVEMHEYHEKITKVQLRSSYYKSG